MKKIFLKSKLYKPEFTEMPKILRFFSKELQKAKSIKISVALDPFNTIEYTVAKLFYLNNPANWDTFLEISHTKYEKFTLRKKYQGAGFCIPVFAKLHSACNPFSCYFKSWRVALMVAPCHSRGSSLPQEGAFLLLRWRSLAVLNLEMCRSSKHAGVPQAWQLPHEITKEDSKTGKKKSS